MSGFALYLCGAATLGVPMIVIGFLFGIMAAQAVETLDARRADEAKTKEAVERAKAGVEQLKQSISNHRN